MKTIWIYSSLMILMIAACSKSNNGLGNNNSGSGALHEDGYGPSQKPFANPAWTLPAGVELVDSIHEYSYCWAFPPYTQVQKKDWRGIPTGFTFCLTLSNKTTGVIIVQFPPELVFVSSSYIHQNVLTIDLGSVSINPGSVVTLVAQGFCINEGRTIPQAYSGDTQELLSYSFGPSQIPAALKEVTDIVHAKHITMNDVLRPDGSIDLDKASKYQAIQSAIWEVTEENGLTKNMRQLLNDL